MSNADRQKALEALERMRDPSRLRYADYDNWDNWIEDIATIRAALAQQPADSEREECGLLAAKDYAELGGDVADVLSHSCPHDSMTYRGSLICTLWEELEATNRLLRSPREEQPVAPSLGEMTYSSSYCAGTEQVELRGEESSALRAQLQEATSRGRRMRVELQAAANALDAAYDAVQSKRYDEALLHCGGGEAAAIRALEDSKG